MPSGGASGGGVGVPESAPRAAASTTATATGAARPTETGTEGTSARLVRLHTSAPFSSSAQVGGECHQYCEFVPNTEVLQPVTLLSRWRRETDA